LHRVNRGGGYRMPQWLALGRVHQYYANWTCLNPGSPDSMCHVELEDKLVDECGTGVNCDSGMCVNI